MHIIMLVSLVMIATAGCDKSEDNGSTEIDTWFRVYQQVPLDNGDICEKPDGGCAVAGRESIDSRILIFDSSGNILNDIEPQKYTRESIYSIVFGQEGAVYATGTASAQTRWYDMKFVPNENYLLERTIELPDTFGAGFCMIESHDDNLILGGAENGHLCVVKMNKNLDSLLWRTTLDGMNGNAYAISELPDDRIVAAGGRSGFMYVVSLAASGEMQTEQQMNLPGYFKDMAISGDRLYAISGANISSGATMAIMDFDLNIDTSFTVSDSGQVFINGITIGANGMPTIVATRFLETNGDGDIWLRQYSQSGDIRWTRTFFSSVDARSYAIASSSDGGFYVLGGTSPEMDMYLVKVNDRGEL